METLRQENKIAVRTKESLHNRESEVFDALMRDKQNLDAFQTHAKADWDILLVTVREHKFLHFILNAE